MVGLNQSLSGANLAFRAGRSWGEHTYVLYSIYLQASSLGLYNPPTIEAKDERPPGIETLRPNEHD